MRFLLDENVGRRIAGALTSDGNDVAHMALLAPGVRDEIVLARAVLEARVLVTYDRDFSDLIFRRLVPTPPAVIYIRSEPDDVLEVVGRIRSVLDAGPIEGHMLVIDDERIRRTPFPARSNDNG